jgi:hypothetical protein
LGTALALASRPPAAHAIGPHPFASGDILAGIGNGNIAHYSSLGTALDTLSTGITTAHDTGMCFDAAGNLRATNWDASNISLIDKNETLRYNSWGGSFYLSPESCVVDRAGEVFVGESLGNLEIDKLDSTGTLLARYHPAVENKGSDWIDLASDQCTIYYTSEGSSVLRFNVCTGQQLSAFATGLAGPCYTTRIVPSTGDVVVACAGMVYYLTAGLPYDPKTSTAVASRALTIDPTNNFYGMDLDPSGSSVWVANQATGLVSNIDFGGNVLGTFTIPVSPPGVAGDCSLCGLSVVGAPTASGGTVAPVGGTGPTVSGGGPYSGTEGSPIPLNASATGTGTLTYSWSYTVTSADSGATCSFSTLMAASSTVTCTDDGTYELEVVVTDGNGNEASAGATLTVAGTGPQLITASGTPNSPSPAADTLIAAPAGTIAAPVTMHFTDAGLHDSYTCQIVATNDIGSTITLSGTTTAPSGATPGSCTATPTLGIGVYCITITVSDSDGDAGETASYVINDIIVYDPNAGFVTGGGTITSPAGALEANPSLTGMANFGFESQYHKGATVPSGQTEFQFQLGNLDFHSVAYQWLVVSGSMAQYKGTGEINGAGTYNFILTARDGDMTGGTNPDGFRIKITDSTGAVVYDNLLGASNDCCTSANTENLSSGNIIIHTGK